MIGYLWLEFIALFGVLPLAYFMGLVPVPKIPVLLICFAACLIYLLKHPEYDRTELMHGLVDKRETLKHIFIRAGIVAVLSILAVLFIDPGLLFRFPRSRPLLWLLVMLLYPLLSALPQELIYRSFFFHRYRRILPSTTMLIWSSALAFSFLHIVFDNWIAVLLTIPAGLIFSRTYLQTGSLLLVSIEHALYGCIVFTSGLGRFFYNPA